MGFGVWGLGFGVWGLGFGVWGLGFGVWGLGLGLRVWGALGLQYKPHHGHSTAKLSCGGGPGGQRPLNGASKRGYHETLNPKP